MKFKAGQEVVCIGGNGWHKNMSILWGTINLKIPVFYAPKKDEIVTVECYGTSSCIKLIEYAKLQNGFRYQYEDRFFEPVMPLDEIEKLLESQPETA